MMRSVMTATPLPRVLQGLSQQAPGQRGGPWGSHGIQAGPWVPQALPFPATPARASKMKPTRISAEEIPWPATQGTADLPQGRQGGVLPGGLQPVQRRAADAEPLGHLRLRDAALLSQPTERLGKGVGKVHAENVWGSTCPHVNI